MKLSQDHFETICLGGQNVCFVTLTPPYFTRFYHENVLHHG